MIRGKKVITVLPAYNAERTLERTYREIPLDVVDEVILVDDASQDRTVQIAKCLNISVILQHEQNRGYGANQKTCYRAALENGADIVIMLHPDYQYTPTLIEPLAWLIAHGTYDIAFGSRVLGTGTLSGGMPLYKYLANRILTLMENILLVQHLSEYHTGYRAYSRSVLQSIPFWNNSDGFLFDNQLIVQAFYAGFNIGEISCPTKYFSEASTMSFSNGVRYALGVFQLIMQYQLQSLGLAQYKIFEGVIKSSRDLNFAAKTSSPHLYG